ncbi:MAG: hypothetical protein J6X02_04010, partial [Bacilli bacterium]|nr:hypothetical protein [Bacilli bacterium]
VDMNTGKKELDLAMYDSIKTSDKYDYYKGLLEQRRNELKKLQEEKHAKKIKRLKRTIASIIIISTIITNAKAFGDDKVKLELPDNDDKRIEMSFNDQEKDILVEEPQEIVESEQTVQEPVIENTNVESEASTPVENSYQEVEQQTINENVNVDERLSWILDNYNLTYDQFVVINAVVNAEAKADSYDDAYAVISAIYNRITNPTWINYIDSIMGEGCGQNPYYQVICPGQFEVYETGRYLNFINDSYPDSDQAVIDMLYSQYPMHGYCSFKSDDTYVEDGVQFVSGGNRFHN